MAILSKKPTANELTPEEEEQALQKIHENKIRKASTKEYIEDVKNSLLFQPGFNWSDLLSAAPISVSLLGSLFVASTIPDATDITIIAPKGGFKYLANFDSDVSLNACLVQCSDTGAKAFSTASNSFDAIVLNTGPIKQTVNEIIAAMGDANLVESQLMPAMKTLTEVAKASEDRAREMEQAFQMWLDVVCELHACVVQTSTNASEKRTANQVQLAAAQMRLASTKEARKVAKKSLDTLQNSLQMATSAYKKAADEFPSGWDLVAQQLVSDLGDSLTNAINLAVPALIENYSMTEKMKAGVNIFEGNNGGAKGGSVGDGKVDNSNVPEATRVPSPTPRATLPYPNDPAYGIIGPIRNYVTTVSSFVSGGPDRGVDWELLKDKDPNKQNNGLGVLAALLQDAQDNFKPSSNPPSTDLTDVFNKTKIVTDGLQEAIKQNETLNGSALPGPDSKDVKQWQLDMQISSAKAVQLDTDSKNLATASSPPSVKETKATSTPTDKKGALRQQIIDAATTKLANLVEVQQKIGEIQGELASLKATNINLDKIKAILVKSIEILVQLKSQINRLVAFFAAVSTLVDHAVNNQVSPFLDYLKASTSAGGPSLLNFSFTEFQQQMIFGYALSIRSFFDLFRDIGQMYLQVHNGFIRQGLEMVNNLQTEYNSAGDSKQKQRILDQRNKEVSDFSSSSIEGVKQLVQSRQQDITDNLASNAADAANSLDFVPVTPTQPVTKAITDSTDASREAAEKGIAQSNKYIPRPLNDTSSLVDDS
ncbi:hypothetical protein BDV32DRAFT_145025 [Aspergillus pseudonomiae]|nr:hypothetical protein BDV32DRAFT_145025 [Aspergillus pseudonomiae]